MNEEFFTSQIVTNLIRGIIMVGFVVYCDMLRRMNKQIKETEGKVDKVTSTVNGISRIVKRWTPKMVEMDSNKFAKQFERTLKEELTKEGVDIKALQPNGRTVKTMARDAYKAAYTECKQDLEHKDNADGGNN